MTRTTLVVGKSRAVTISVGESAVLRSATTPTPDGGHVTLRLDYDDPLAEWVFRRLWTVDPQGSLTFTPDAVGTWRIVASFSGTGTSSPSRSEYVTVDVKSRQ